MDDAALLAVAIEEARRGLDEGGIPIGAALFDARGHLLGKGHNRRVQEGDPSAHGETDAFRKSGRQRNYREIT
ncbi:MAG TPA: nucleoside deaminase, partial [Thermoanaerobaculia bacterium]